MSAVDKLQSDFYSGKIKVFSLQNSNSSKNEIKAAPIWYEIADLKDYRGGSLINSAKFFTSHYVGFYSTYINGSNIEILVNPRFGYNSKLFNYLLSFTYNIYLPKGKSNYDKYKHDSYWIMALLWRSMLEAAITRSQIPKEYYFETKNLNFFRGRINLSKNIQTNLIDQSRFYCTYRKLSMDNTINRAIRYTYKLLCDKGVKNILTDINEYDIKLQSFGVKNREIRIHELDKIKYTRLNVAYKSLMQFSKSIIQKHLAASAHEGQLNADFGYFIDISQIWENYLLKVLRSGLKEYHVYSPNYTGGEFLLFPEVRNIRPDIIIEKDNSVVAIIDAKYKSYSQFGRIEKQGISREDLYQMNTYLYHYGRSGIPIVGLFVSPVKGDISEVYNYKTNPKHRIGLVNLPIDNFAEQDDYDGFLSMIDEIENGFLDKIKKLLD